MLSLFTYTQTYCNGILQLVLNGLSPSLVRQKRAISLLTKKKIIEAVEKNVKTRKQISAEFKIGSSTMSTILKNKSIILNDLANGSNINRKRKRAAKFGDIEECLVTWFKQAREKKISINSIILQEKAEFFAKNLNHLNEFRGFWDQSNDDGDDGDDEDDDDSSKTSYNIHMTKREAAIAMTRTNSDANEDRCNDHYRYREKAKKCQDASFASTKYEEEWCESKKLN
ncbi:hypothetical protein TKK_0016495 [Trichogramma kaykai]